MQMSYWRRHGELVVDSFTAGQTRLLFRHLDAYRRLLADAATWREVRDVVVVDAGQGHYLAESHSRATAIATRRDGAGELCRDRLEQMRGDAQTVLGTLRPGSRHVVLPYPQEVSAWIWTMHEHRMDLAARRDMPWSDQRTVDWLREVTNDLAGVLDFTAWLS